MADMPRNESKAEAPNVAEKSADKAGDGEKPININDVDMQAFAPMKNGFDRLPQGFNHIENSTFDLLANKDGFVTKDGLKKAIENSNLDDVQKDDVQHMLTNFKLLSKEFDDKDGGKRGISREDVAKYNFPHDVNHIESSTVDKLAKAADGTITKDALADGLKRTDLNDIERDDIKYLQRQYANIKALSPDGASGGKNELGISTDDIALSNRRTENYVARVTNNSPFQLIDRYNNQRMLDALE